MAEKEDYIVISKKDFDYKKGHYVIHLAKQMPRQEAIKRMAEAMNDLTRKALESKKTPCIPPETYAEAMLNSILEVK